FGPGTPDLGVPRVRTPLRTRLLGCSRARPDGQLRLPNRPGRRQGVGQPPVGVSARLSVVADEVEGGGARGEPYPTGAFPTFEGRPPVPARSGICGPEGEESEEEDFDDQQGDERAPCTSWGSSLRLSLERRVEEWRWDDAVWPPDRRTCASATPEWSRLPGG